MWVSQFIISSIRIFLSFIPRSFVVKGCQNHDRCYKWGAGIGANCECNRQLVYFIKVNRPWIPESALGVADAIRVYCETIGATGC